MMLPDAGMPGFFGNPPGDVQLGGLDVKISFCDGDGQGDAFAVRGSATRGGFHGYFADGGGAEEVRRAD